MRTAVELAGGFRHRFRLDAQSGVRASRAIAGFPQPVINEVLVVLAALVYFRLSEATWISHFHLKFETRQVN